MSARRRRGRRRDPIASRDAINRILGSVREGLSADDNFSQSDLIKALRAGSHRERAGWEVARRGRKPTFSNDTLRRVWNALEAALRQERASGVSGRTFVENYLRLLDSPADVVEALESGKINLFEALQLARIRPETAETTAREAAQLRAKILQTHLVEHASARQLSERIDTMLGRTAVAPQVRRREPEEDDEPIDEGIDQYISDPSALFADQLRQVAAALSELDPDAIPEDEITAILDLLDKLYLHAIKAGKAKHKDTKS